MAKYRKKPVVVEAFQWFRCLSVTNAPAWYRIAYEDGRVQEALWGSSIAITNYNGERCLVTEGSYVVMNKDGRMDSCLRDAFEMTYEPVGEDEHVKPDIKPVCSIKPIINIYTDTSKETIEKLCDVVIEYATKQPTARRRIELPENPE